MQTDQQISPDDIQAIEHQALDGTSLGHAIVDENGRFVHLNNAICKMLGYKRDELLKQPMFKIVPVMRRTDAAKYLDSLLKQRLNTIQHTTSLLHKNGDIFPSLVSGTFVEKNQAKFIVYQYVDIGNQLILEDEFSDSINFHKLISQNDPDIIYIKDSLHNVVYANQSYIELFPDKNLDEIIGQQVTPRCVIDNESFNHDVLALKQGNLETLETYLDRHQEEIILRARRTRFMNNDGDDFILCIAKDVTDQEQLIQQLKRSNEDLGQFAYVASHDLRSPLNAIEKLVSWIDEDEDNKLSEPSIEYFDLIKKRIGRLTHLLDDLLSYAKIGDSDYDVEWINLKRLAKNINGMLGTAKKFKITAPDKDIYIARVPFELVIRNLVSNSVKHHDQGRGNIAISLVEEGGFYIISVQDDGPGIPPELHKKAAEIFQTLKPRDQVEGSGMGLALVSRIMDLYMGEFKIESDGTRGTNIILRWPSEH